MLALTLTVVSTPRVDDARAHHADAGVATNSGAPKRATASWRRPTFPPSWRQCKAQGADVDLDDVTYYVGHETVVPREDGNGLPRWQDALSRRWAATPRASAITFKLPSDHVVEIGREIEI